MVAVPGGKFRLIHGSGATADVPTYVSVDPFLLDVTEVTVAAYGECVRAGRCAPAQGTVKWDRVGDADRARWSPSCNQDRPDRADHPVNCVDWDQATSFCAWAGKRLPTGEEWEWAARDGPAGAAFPWGSAAPADRPCWNGEANDQGRGKREGTCAAGSHPADANALGVKDLGGGVAEWTTSEMVMGADSRGRGGSTVKVYRGGSWADDDPLRVAHGSRGGDYRSRRDPRIGFRCASGL